VEPAAAQTKVEWRDACKQATLHAHPPQPTSLSAKPGAGGGYIPGEVLSGPVAMKRCMDSWDKGTGMTKAEWRATVIDQRSQKVSAASRWRLSRGFPLASNHIIKTTRPSTFPAFSSANT
jgi:hypothetical protein